MFHPLGPSFYELTVQALSSTERGYDLLAPKFEYTPFRTPDPVLATWAARVGAPGSIDTALDVCCGTGAAMRFMRPLCRRAVVGIDFSAGMLDEARRRTADAFGSSRVSFVRGNAFEMPFEGVFDLATSFGAFGHILPEDEPRFARAIARALKPGGRFSFVTARLPKPLSKEWVVSRAFNAVMHVRNALVKPPFIMYYLTFLWPDVKSVLEASGFDVEADENAFGAPFERAIIVTATRRADDGARSDR